MALGGDQQHAHGEELDRRHPDAGDEDDQGDVPRAAFPELDHSAADGAVDALPEHLGTHDRQQVGRHIEDQRANQIGPGSRDGIALAGVQRRAATFAMVGVAARIAGHAAAMAQAEMQVGGERRRIHTCSHRRRMSLPAM
ncbi:hypothetical protein D9M71_190040 [compost metagenome]